MMMHQHEFCFTKRILLLLHKDVLSKGLIKYGLEFCTTGSMNNSLLETVVEGASPMSDREMAMLKPFL